MPKTTTFILDDRLEAFVEEQVKTGSYSTASEVIRDALRRLKRRKQREAYEAKVIDEGEASGISPLSHDEVIAHARAARAARGIR